VTCGNLLTAAAKWPLRFAAYWEAQGEVNGGMQLSVIFNP